MKTRTHPLGITIAAIALALAATDAAAINKCVDRGGKVTYQEGGCPDDARQDTVKVPEPAAPPATPDEAADEQLALSLASTESTFDACGAVSPEFSTLHAADYDAWRAANKAQLAKVERTPRYQQILKNGGDQLREQGLLLPGNREKYAQFCIMQFIPALRRITAR